MKRQIQRLIGAIALLFLLASIAFAKTNEPLTVDGYVEGEVLVVAKKTTNQNRLSSLSRNAAIKEIDRVTDNLANSVSGNTINRYLELSIASDKIMTLIKSDTKSTKELIALLKNNKEVLSVSPNYIRKQIQDKRTKELPTKQISAQTPNDPYYTKQWGLDAINAPAAWNKTTGSKDVYVVVIDTGIDYEHEDLADNMGSFTGEFNGTSVVRILNSFYVSNGAWYRKGDTHTFGVKGPYSQYEYLSTMGDMGTHGTHVAGIIGAVGNNNLGVVGVNWGVKLLGLSVTDAVYSPRGDLIEIGLHQDAGIIYALEMVLAQKRAGVNIRVVNISLGGWYTPKGENDPYYLALDGVSNANIIIALASGNEYQNMDAPDEKHTGQLAYPACFKLQNSITVGSVNKAKSWSEFANYSPNYVDIAAPGEEILSTVSKYYLEFPYIVTNSVVYELKDGTSMATPYVAGAAALLCSAYPNKSAKEIKSLLLNNADKTFAKTGRSAYGLLDLGAAMKAGEPPAPPTPTPTPTPSSDGGGGCNSGQVLSLLFAIIPLAYFTKKK